MTMVQQTVTFTPPTDMSTDEALTHISGYLPDNVLTFLNEQTTNGGRTTSASIDSGTHTIVTQWSDEAASQYTTLMASVSDGVKFQLVADGWDISFSPETADL
jgi:hypothetical protein